MKKNGFYFGGLLVLVSLLSSSGPKPQQPWEKENVSFPMMNQEIRHTMEENERQKEMKNKQVSNTGTETVNKGMWKEFKETTQKVQDRLRFLDFAMQSVPTGYALFLESQEIAKLQNKTIAIVQDTPYLIPIILPTQVQFGDEVQMIVRYIAGIVLSYGSINQMEKAERKILLDYALEEIRRIKEIAHSIYFQAWQTKNALEWKKNTVLTWINQDKQIVGEIIKNVKF
ncbi:MAG: hypothetical protein QM564_12010 [Bergeyella sp.]